MYYLCLVASACWCQILVFILLSFQHHFLELASVLQHVYFVITASATAPADAPHNSLYLCFKISIIAHMPASGSTSSIR